jgi:hypothetical protein
MEDEAEPEECTDSLFFLSLKSFWAMENQGNAEANE